MNDSTPTSLPDPYDELGALYDEWCAEVVEDIPFYRALAAALARDLQRDQLRIVELGGGSGRVSIPLALDGHHVVAIDTSGAQLDRLRERAGAAGVLHRVTTVHDDMRRLGEQVPEGSVDLVIAPFRSLLHGADDAAQLCVAAHDVLVERGVFAFDVFHPSTDTVTSSHDRWLQRRTARTASGRWRFYERICYGQEPDDRGAFRAVLSVRCVWQPRGGIARRARRGDRTVPEPADGLAVEQTATLELRLLPAASWGAVLETSGFELDGTYGWFDGRPLAAGDEDSIWVARRAD